ncbi:hypothetical protein AAG570_013231 [Ranatra chinensis]|uniref:Endoplasmic reticulum metallopeptidase 1-like C-terminal domain-containing protein n=1 Tax=Ranatra chinensis TaxID=642074 RepID=A0ABD0YG75_9HEMI
MMILPFIQGGYIVNGALLTTVPIMGRSGSGNHSELVLSLIACAMFLLLLNFVQHVERTFHGPNYKVLDHQGGYWVVDLDVNSPQSVMSIVPDMALAQQVDDCNTRLYCGLPYIIPVLTLIWRTHWIPGSMPIISVPTSLSLINKTTTHGVTRYWFSAIGPDHMTLMMSPTKNVHLLSWSFVSGRPLIGPKWNGRDTYFVYYSCASAPEEWQFWIDLKVIYLAIPLRCKQLSGWGD